MLGYEPAQGLQHRVKKSRQGLTARQLHEAPIKRREPRMIPIN
jgi:hypothetical protein